MFFFLNASFKSEKFYIEKKLRDLKFIKELLSNLALLLAQDVSYFDRCSCSSLLFLPFGISRRRFRVFLGWHLQNKNWTKI